MANWPFLAVTDNFPLGDTNFWALAVSVRLATTSQKKNFFILMYLCGQI